VPLLLLGPSSCVSNAHLAAVTRVETAELLGEVGIPTTVILDSAVGFYMEQVSMVIAGAEGVVENGGIVNSVRSYAGCLLVSLQD